MAFFSLSILFGQSERSLWWWWSFPLICNHVSGIAVCIVVDWPLKIVVEFRSCFITLAAAVAVVHCLLLGNWWKVPQAAAALLCATFPYRRSNVWQMNNRWLSVCLCVLSNKLTRCSAWSGPSLHNGLLYCQRDWLAPSERTSALLVVVLTHHYLFYCCNWLHRCIAIVCHRCCCCWWRLKTDQAQTHNHRAVH